MRIFIHIKLFAQDLFRFKVELYDFADSLTPLHPIRNETDIFSH